VNGIDAFQTIRPVGHEREPLPAPPKTKTQRAEGYAGLPAVLDLGEPACPILLQQLFNLFRLSVVRTTPFKRGSSYAYTWDRTPSEVSENATMS